MLMLFISRENRSVTDDIKEVRAVLLDVTPKVVMLKHGFTFF